MRLVSRGGWSAQLATTGRGAAQLLRTFIFALFALREGGGFNIIHMQALIHVCFSAFCLRLPCFGCTCCVPLKQLQLCMLRCLRPMREGKGTGQAAGTACPECTRAWAVGHSMRLEWGYYLAAKYCRTQYVAVVGLLA